MLKLLIAGGGGQEEYFLIENRQLEGYDRSLPLCYNGYYDEEADDFIWSWLGGGLLVYHIYPNRYTPTMVNLVGHYNWEAPYFATDRRFPSFKIKNDPKPFVVKARAVFAWDIVGCQKALSQASLRLRRSEAEGRRKSA